VVVVAGKSELVTSLDVKFVGKHAAMTSILGLMVMLDMAIAYSSL
jgi:hypothetical protein